MYTRRSERRSGLSPQMFFKARITEQLYRNGIVNSYPFLTQNDSFSHNDVQGILSILCGENNLLQLHTNRKS